MLQRLALASAIALACTTARADAAANDTATNSDDTAALRATIAALEQRLAILERRLELADEDAAAKATTLPAVSFGEKGLSVKNAPPGDFELKLRGGVQFDHRIFTDDDEVPLSDTSLLRRVRPTLEGNLGPLISYRLTPELAEDSVTLLDAWLDLKFDPRASLRVGRMKGPVGLERLQSFTALPLIERGFPTELAPSREVGAQLFGEFATGTVQYAVGVFNGAPDGRNGTASNPDDELELEARLFFEPWKNDANAWSGLGFGIAGSIGEKEGAGNNFLPRYRTPGQNVFFNYRNTVVADGDHVRWTPQAYWYRNAFGLLAEYIESEQEVRVGNEAATVDLAHDAWSLTGSWVLTGEAASYRGVTKPSRPYAAGGDGWGAFELVARYGELDVDDDAFPRYADPAAAASAARAWGLGLNWYLTANLKLAFNQTWTTFDGGAPSSGDREDEKAFFSRVQVSF